LVRFRARRDDFGKRPVHMAKTALITGITGQDGSFLAELLLDKGYEVYGIIRRSSSFNTDRIEHLYQDPHEQGTRLHLVYGDLNDSSSLNTILRQIHPDEIYNLGAQSHVRVSFDIPEYTGEVTGLGTVPVDDGGNAAFATNEAGGPLACPATRHGRELLDRCHDNVLYFVSRALPPGVSEPARNAGL